MTKPNPSQSQYHYDYYTETKHSDLFSRHTRWLRMEIVLNLNNWLWDNLTYYSPNNWQFMVTAQNHYRSKCLLEPKHRPSDFLVRFHNGNLRYTNSIFSDPLTREELHYINSHLYKCLAPTFINLLGLTDANHLLKPIQLRNKDLFPRLKRADYDIDPPRNYLHETKIRYAKPDPSVPILITFPPENTN